MRKLNPFLLLIALAVVAGAQTMQLSVNRPANGATVPAKFTLTGTASPSMIVECVGDLRGSVYADQQGNWRLPLEAGSLPDGTVVNLLVQARDNANNRSPAVPLRYALKQGNAGQESSVQVSVNRPANGATVPQSFFLTGTATPSMIVECEGDLRGSVYADKEGRWRLPLDGTALAVGTVVNLIVQARDSDNNRSRAVPLRYALKAGREEVTIDLSVNTPANGATVGNTFELRGTASPEMIVEATGTLRGSVYADKQGNWRIPLDATSLAAGAPIELTVTARDSYGHKSRTVSVRYAKR